MIARDLLAMARRRRAIRALRRVNAAVLDLGRQSGDESPFSARARPRSCPPTRVA